MKAPALKRKMMFKIQPKYCKVLQSRLIKDFQVNIFPEPLYQVGRGGFGKCYLGKLGRSNEQQIGAEELRNKYEEILGSQSLVVVKQIPKNPELSKQDQIDEEKQYLNQIDNLASIHRKYAANQCKNIVKVYPFEIVSENHYYIVMQYCYHATLADLMARRKKTKRKFCLGQFLAILQDLVNGYGLLYSSRIIHNDLKPQNIFIKDSVFKIGDFGISIRLHQNQKSCISKKCTKLYSPIEKLQNKEINHKADIYSLGLILAEIMFGEHPYFDEASWLDYLKLMRQKHEKDSVIELPSTTDDLLHNMISPKQRQTAYFISYLKERTRLPLDLPMQLQHNCDQPEQVALVQTLRKMVIMMIGPEQKRPTYLNIRKMITEMANYHVIMWKDKKFQDLEVLRRSEMSFQMQSIENMKYSYIQPEALGGSAKREKFNLIEADLPMCLLSRLRETSNFVHKFYELASEIINESNIGYIQVLQLQIYRYLFWVNQQELLAVTQQMSALKETQQNELFSMNIEKVMRINRIDGQELSQRVYIDLENNQYEQSRMELLSFLNNQFLNNIVISHQNWQQYLWLFICSDLVEIQQDYAGHPSKKGMDLRIQEVLRMKEMIHEQEKVDLYHIFEKWKASYVIFFQ